MPSSLKSSCPCSVAVSELLPLSVLHLLSCCIKNTQLTRLCNAIFKRLGKHDVVNKARLLMLTASCTPLFDRSGVNVTVGGLSLHFLHVQDRHERAAVLQSYG